MMVIMMSEIELLEPIVEEESDRLTEVQSGRAELRKRLRRNTNSAPLLSGGDVDAQWEMAESCGDETAGGSTSTPDQNVVEEYGEALGILYQGGETLRVGDKERERDLHRWELDPASAEDYAERSRAVPRTAPRTRFIRP